jgi:hypothetical protein
MSHEFRTTAAFIVTATLVFIFAAPIAPSGSAGDLRILGIMTISTMFLIFLVYNVIPTRAKNKHILDEDHHE